MRCRHATLCLLADIVDSTLFPAAVARLAVSLVRLIIRVKHGVH